MLEVVSRRGSGAVLTFEHETYEHELEHYASSELGT